MFTGIIESSGEVREIITSGSNRSFWIRCPLSAEFKPDQSIAHDGVCLTVEDIKGDHYKVTAVKETLKKTALSHWRTGSRINLERALIPGNRLDGHFVQGHVDTVGLLQSKTDLDGSWEMMFTYPKEFSSLIIEKGSICVNGVSLTAFEVKKKSFKVAVIPFTWEHTNLSRLDKGDEVNLEFDLIGKYIQKRKS
jgi:riboflavin synthase